jgi:LPXTG-motif cell wall-anchored protein
MLQNVTVKAWERIGGVLLFVTGWALGGLSFEPIGGQPWNTLFFLGGPPLILGGLYLFLRKKS